MKVPAIGESVTEVTISEWLKKDGDIVEMDEIIAEIETDKATQELPAEGAGKLKIVAQEGETIEIGAVICEIDDSVTGNSDSPSTNAPEQKEEKEVPSNNGPVKTGELKEMVVAAVGESITEVTVGQWFKQTGDYVEMDEIIAEIESDKATFDLPAEAAGYLQIVAEEGTVLEIGGLICKIEVTEGGAPAQPASATTTASKSDTSSDESYAKGHPSPAASKILAEKGISPESVEGSGVDGRITKQDAQSAEKKPNATETPSSPQSQPQPLSEGSRVSRTEKMSSLRRTISRRLVAVKNETAMLTTFNEVDMKPIMDLRKKYKEQFKEKHGVGLGFMSFFTKACCQALLEWPSVNGQIDGNDMVFHNYCDISIAVSTPRGLVVPVIRNAELLDFKGIESEVMRLALKARDNKLSIDEMTGGTFTITNGGVFGSMMSTPIINAPQSAILGMHNIVERAVVENGEIVVRPMMYVALSYDHRIIDGKESVSFLVRVKQLLEDPARLMLGV
jgi:2-oxoglutarate dehydrogenase E2 component (dihydrolipoamide succinyltransferase)